MYEALCFTRFLRVKSCVPLQFGVFGVLNVLRLNMHQQERT